MFRNLRRHYCYQACLILFFTVCGQSTAWSQQVGNNNAPPPRVPGGQDTQILVPLPNTGAVPSDVQVLQSQTVESESLPVSRIQSGFPEELILPPPDSVAVERANRLVTGTINPELPLNLVVGRPKVLQLAKAAKRIYVPGVGVIRTEIIDEESGREVAITGIAPGTTTLIFWFDDPNEPGGQSTVSYLVRVFDDPILARPITELADDLNTKFPNCFIELDQIEDRLIVKGQVPTITEMAQILQVL
ncbi:MAG: hypothetical protein GY904_25080, partial [Planctomycetaceae bacterium]|nr:hypothetical protein [Planctomycetaceae bacterium]